MKPSTHFLGTDGVILQKMIRIARTVLATGNLIFSIFGTVEERKGQDIFLKAVLSLPDEYRKKAIFNIIGKRIARTVLATGILQVFKRI